MIRLINLLIIKFRAHLLYYRCKRIDKSLKKARQINQDLLKQLSLLDSKEKI